MIFTKDYSRLLLIPEGKEGAASLPDQTTLVPAAAFSRCSSLSRLLVGDSATFTSYDGVLYSKDLKTLVACPAGIGASIVIPAETETIDKDALSCCKNLASVTVLGAVQKIDPTAFSDETKAKAVVALPAGEDYDTRKATWEQAGFTNFAEPAKPGETTNQDINNEATGLTYTLLDDYTLSVSWQGKDDPEANLEIPSSAEINGVPYRVSTIAENAFANRGSLTSVKLPTTITAINNAAFSGCANLSTIEFPNTLRTIGDRAFEATSLKDVWLPASIESIGSRALASCSNLERVVALGTPEVATDALAGCTGISIYIRSGAEDTWNPGLPADGNHLMPYGVSLSEEPLALEAGQEANLLEGGNLQAPDPIEASYSYAAAPLSVDAGTVSAKKEGTSDVTAVLSLDGVELTRASRTVEISPNRNGEPTIEMLNSDVPLPSAYLAEARDNQITVVAPFNVTFGQDAPYDVAANQASIEASNSFKNNGSAPVQLAQVTCGPLAVATYIQPKSGSLDSQELFSIYPKGNAGAAVNFGYGLNNSIRTPNDPGAFVIPPTSSSDYTFRLNLNNAEVNPGAADNGSTVRPLVSVTCTFAQYSGSFYLKDNNTGRAYSLSEVKAHANDISANGTNSAYWNQYQGYIGNESSYTCQTVWPTGVYDVLIIGIYHDEKINDSKAGLTFQFKNTIVSGKYEMRSYTGWGQSLLRARMNPDNLSNVDGVVNGVVNGSDDNAIWIQVPIELQNTIEVVKKYYGPKSDDNTATVLTSNDKLFVPSLIEVRGTGTNWDATKPWITKEGSQYEYYAYRNVGAGLSACIIKDNIWWERTLYPENSSLYFCVDTIGNPLGVQYSSNGDYVSPCFCL